MKNLSKSQEIMTIQHKIYLIIYIMKIIVNLLVQIYLQKLIRTNFVGKLEEDDGATIFSNAKKQQKTILNFSLDSLIVT